MTEPLPPAPGTETAGALLRAAREKQGLHIAALAASIKVSPRKLDALENDRWHELPDATFTRALAQTVCRTLKIDARPVLERLPPVETTGLEHVAGSLNAPFGGGDAAGRFGPGAIRPLVWAAGVLMLAALVVLLLPASVWEGDAAPVAEAPLAPAAGASGASAWPASAVQPGTDMAASGGAALVVEPAATASAAATAPAPAVAASAPVPVGGPSAPVPAAPGTARPADATSVTAPAVTASPITAPAPVDGAGAPLQLRAAQATWVEARDGSGRLLLSRELRAGERLALGGALPLRLVIGNAAGTELVFRGQPVDLASSTRDNVARVELR